MAKRKLPFSPDSVSCLRHRLPMVDNQLICASCENESAALIRQYTRPDLGVELAKLLNAGHIRARNLRSNDVVCSDELYRALDLAREYLAAVGEEE